MRASVNIGNAAPTDTASLIAYGNAAAAQWRDEEAVPALKRGAAADAGDPRRWQILGILQRNLEHHADALISFGRAAALAPDDPSIVHSLARTTLEAGLPATALFERARTLAPLDAPVLLGRAAAQLAEARIGDAITDLAEELAKHPGWYDGHRTAARLHWLAGQGDRNGETFEGALRQRPRDGLLWREYALMVLRAGEFERVPRLTARARRALGESRTLDLIDASALSEAGETSAAEPLFAGSVPFDFLPLFARHLLRFQRPDEAKRVLEPHLAKDQTRELLPLASLAWRWTSDPRWDELHRGRELIRVVDLAQEVGSLTTLAETLRVIHKASHSPLDQTLRCGTQTDGPLFARIEPVIQSLRAVILSAVADYVDALPSYVERHPMLGVRRSPLRFAGSWSVRLTDEGHHVDHVHPAGWISSAFYVALPEGSKTDSNHAGWLTLGDAPSLKMSLAPIVEIEPKPGRLVLFPSTMWHRTHPFAAGERLTVAFDIGRSPR